MSTHLPNVERFPQSYKSSYFPTLNALLDNRLTKLNFLSVPDGSSDSCKLTNYTTCALLIKNRLENLRISDTFDDADENHIKSLFDLLYSRMNQFEKLRTVSIRKNTNQSIQVLEYITDACKTLKAIEFEFSSSGGEPDLSTMIDVDTNSNLEFSPRSNIKSLDGIVDASSFHKVFSYIIHKFPQLQNISLASTPNTEDTLVAQHTIVLLHNQISKIDNYFVSVKVNKSEIWDTIGNIWDATSELGSENLTIQYEEASEECRLSISKSKSSTRRTQLYPCHPHWAHAYFIENYGKYIGSLEFSFTIAENIYFSDVRELPENFLGHLITHCPHLKSLVIQYYILRRCSYYNMDLSKRLSLSLLSLDDCAIYAGALEQLSLFLPRLKTLRLGIDLNFFCNSGDAEIDTAVDVNEIVMPYTIIDEVLFGKQEDEPLYLKFFSLGEQKHYIYKCEEKNEDEMDIKEIDEVEYLDGNYGKHYYICSQTLPRFSFW
ncbi:unnamed protein product [Mucor hiemalis]